MITQLEPDVLECEVKQYFRNITTNKALGGDGIQLSSFNSKRLCCECAALHRPANLGNAAVARGLEEVSFHFNHNKRQSKEWANYRLTAIISHPLKALLKIPKATLRHNVNHELTDAQGGFRKGKRTGDQIANIRRVIKKGRECQESMYSYLTMPKTCLCRSQQNV